MKNVINNIASAATWGGIIAFFGIESNPAIAGWIISFLVLSTVTYLASYEPENDVRHED